MSKRNRIIVIAATAVLALLLMLLLLWWLNRKPTIQPAANTNVGLQLPGSLPSSSAGPTNVNQLPAEKQDLEASLKAIAFTFAERFGSYSNQGGFANLDALKDLMTIKMKAWADNYKLSQKSFFDASQPYYGITTQALSVDLNNLDEVLGRAEVLVSTQRRETKVDTANPRVFYQNLKLSLAKVGESWKVDAADWQ
ncbi:MAG: hypothetical protein WC768_02240 [Patescibacteria group bacterium]|jgi:hypothetical protein